MEPNWMISPKGNGCFSEISNLRYYVWVSLDWQRQFQRPSRCTSRCLYQMINWWYSSSCYPYCQWQAFKVKLQNANENFDILTSLQCHGLEKFHSIPLLNLNHSHMEELGKNDMISSYFLCLPHSARPLIIGEEPRWKSEQILEKKRPYAGFSPNILGQVSGSGQMSVRT